MPPAHIPIYVAVARPANLRLTGELADGWIGNSFFPETADVFLDPIREGAAAAGRTLADLDLTVSVGVEFTDDVDAAGRRHAEGYAFTFGAMGSATTNFYNDAFDRQGYGDDVREVQRLWLAGDKDAARKRVPIAIGLGTNLIGTDDLIRDRLRLYRDAGITTLRAGLQGDSTRPPGSTTSATSSTSRERPAAPRRRLLSGDDLVSVVRSGARHARWIRRRRSDLQRPALRADRGERVVDLACGAMQPDSLLPVYSSSKGATAVVVALLVERGQLDLDARVAHYWPEFAAVRQGRDHRRASCSRTRQASPASTAASRGRKLLAHDALAERLAAQRPFWQPGQAFMYHGADDRHARRRARSSRRRSTGRGGIARRKSPAREASTCGWARPSPRTIASRWHCRRPVRSCQRSSSRTPVLSTAATP